MNRINCKVFHLILSVLLTVSVTDFLWVELIDDHQIVAEMEIEKETEKESAEEEQVENRFPVDRQANQSSESRVLNPSSGFVKHGATYEVLQRKRPPLFIEHCQLKLNLT